MSKININISPSKKLEFPESGFHSSLDSKTYLILISISLIFLFYSIWEIKPVVVNNTDFLGLTSHLTLAYWIGFLILIFSSIRLYLDTQYKNTSIYIIHLLTLGVYLFGLPVFAEENAWFAWSYYPAGEVQNVLINKYININSEDLLAYNMWPATHIVSAFLILIGDIGLMSIIKYMPLFWMIALIFFTFVMGRIFHFSPDQSFLLSFMILTSFVLFLYYYGPPSIAYLIFVMIFILLNDFSINQKYDEYVPLTLFISALIITHLLTSLVVMVMIFIMYLNERRFKTLMLFSIIFFFSYYIFIAPFMFKIAADNISKILIVNKSIEFVETNMIFQIPRLLKYTYLAIYIISVIFVTLNLLYNKTLLNNKKSIHCLMWFTGIGLFLMLNYGSEMDDRLYIYSIIPAATYIIANISNRSKILITIMVIFLFLHIPAHYGSESMDMVYTTELYGSKFFALRMEPGNEYPISINYVFGPLLDYYHPLPFYKRWSISPYRSGIYNPSNASLEDSTYIIHSKQTNNYLLSFFGYDSIKLWLESNKTPKLIYTNGYYNIYKNNI
ncbi:MAG: hypothetical protein FIB07_03250 [Candidatus Methanoperedens sp.]|nr:hypothetical protein [Candidatus Methanoperedens sp.]